MNTIRNWWRNNQTNLMESLSDLGSGFERIVINITRLMIIGVVVNIIASYFYPEFPERFPIIYGWFDGWLQLGELALKSAIGAIYSIFTGNFSEFWAEYTASCEEFWSQFVNWLSQIHF